MSNEDFKVNINFIYITEEEKEERLEAIASLLVRACLRATDKEIKKDVLMNHKIT